MTALYVILGIVVVGVIIFLLVYFVFSRAAIKKQVSDLERKFNFLDGLLSGQDANYIRRLNDISQTNLLYADKYNTYYTKHAELRDNSRYAKTQIDCLRGRVNDKQYKNIKIELDNAKKVIAEFEGDVNAFDSELVQILKPEQDSRSQILSIKDNFQRVKQVYSINAQTLKIASASFNEIFEKVERQFAEYDHYVSDADYASANAMVNGFVKIIKALEEKLTALPNLCILATSVVPNKIHEILNEYLTVEKEDIPLQHLNFRGRLEDWKNTLMVVEKELSELKTTGIQERLEAIENDISNIRTAIQNETADHDDFDNESKDLYEKVVNLEQSFIKVTSLMPLVKENYVITSEHQTEIENLKTSIDNLSSSRRNLDNYVHSPIKQPYSVLKEQLDSLKNDFELAQSELMSFKYYVKSLKTNFEEACAIMYAYFYHTKQIEAMIKDMGVECLHEKYDTDIENIYEQLNNLDAAIKTKPTDIDAINELVEKLKNFANTLFDEVESKNRSQKLAESAILYVNRDRGHQTDVHQQLNVLEKSFFDGNFDHVYQEANSIYRQRHVEDGSEGNR